MAKTRKLKSKIGQAKMKGTKEPFVDEELVKILEQRGLKRNPVKPDSEAKVATKTKKRKVIKKIQKPVKKIIRTAPKIQEIEVAEKPAEEKGPSAISIFFSKISNFFSNIKEKMKKIKIKDEEELDSVTIIAPKEDLRELRSAEASYKSPNENTNIAQTIKDEINPKKEEQKSAETSEENQESQEQSKTSENTADGSDKNSEEQASSSIDMLFTEKKKKIE